MCNGCGPETSTIPVNSYRSGVQREATAATQCKENTILYRLGTLYAASLKGSRPCSAVLSITLAGNSVS